MLRSSLASLIVDLNLRRTLRLSSPAAHLSRSSGCVFAPRHSSHKAITFRVQRCRPHHRVTPSFSSSSYPPPPSSSSKVLTLPTVLTLCRVAAVPLLVASRPLYTCSLFGIDCVFHVKVFTFLLLLLTTSFGIVLLLVAFYVDGWWGATATTSIFVAAAVTDWLDGYLARKVLSFFFFISLCV